jgi:hypothetical protein
VHRPGILLSPARKRGKKYSRAPTGILLSPARKRGKQHVFRPTDLSPGSNLAGAVRLTNIERLHITNEGHGRTVPLGLPPVLLNREKKRKILQSTPFFKKIPEGLSIKSKIAGTHQIF